MARFHRGCGPVTTPTRARPVADRRSHRWDLHLFRRSPHARPLLARPRPVPLTRRLAATGALALGQRDDPGTGSPIGGYAPHCCALPRYRNPTIAACACIGSGLRIFDIRDPKRPKEIVLDRERRQVWYTDLSNGFFAVRLTNDIWPTGL